jgi:ABC-type glycerol-3-phosphate transport system substrate-binding protein
MRRVLVAALSLSLLLALLFGAGTATATTGSQITVACHWWPKQTKVHWDAEWWKAHGYRVVSVFMSWYGIGTAYATIDGETAHHTTLIFADKMAVTVNFQPTLSRTVRDIPCTFH